MKFQISGRPITGITPPLRTKSGARVLCEHCERVMPDVPEEGTCRVSLFTNRAWQVNYILCPACFKRPEKEAKA